MEGKAMLNRKDWLLVALARAPGEMSPVQVQKSMFLLKMEAGDYVGPDFYEFTRYNYGPFNVQIYNDLDLLAAEGLVNIDESPNRRWRSYSATPRGFQRGEELRADPDEQVADFLERVVEWVRTQSFSSLLRAIYAKYPEYKENSVFVD